MTAADIVKEVRHALTLTQERLGAELGVSGTTVSRWERGSVMSLAALARLRPLAERGALQMPLAYIDDAIREFWEGEERRIFGHSSRQNGERYADIVRRNLRLEAALRAVEWLPWRPGDDTDRCLVCEQEQKDGHSEGCAIAEALA